VEHARRIVMFNWVTADGYFAGTDGNLDLVVPGSGAGQSGRGGHHKFRYGPVWTSDVRSLRGILAAGRRRRLRHSSRPASSGTTISGTRRNSDGAKQNDENSLLAEHEGRELGELPLASRTRPARDCDHEGPIGKGFDHLRQRLHRVAAHGARSDRRVSVRRLPGAPRKWPAVAPWCIETVAAKLTGSQAAPVGRRHPSIYAVEARVAVSHRRKGCTKSDSRYLLRPAWR